MAILERRDDLHLKNELVCLLLDENSTPLGRGELESEPDWESPNMRMHISGGDTGRVEAAEAVLIIPMNHQLPDVVGRVIYRRGNNVIFERLRQSGDAMRENFRLDVDFASFVYPARGGRVPVRALDLSCGGIAMYAAWEFTRGDEMEVVIPITAEGPLILDCKILRATPYGIGIWLYAAKFVDMIHDQEAALRSALFSTQLEQIKIRKSTRK